MCQMNQFISTILSLSQRVLHNNSSFMAPTVMMMKMEMMDSRAKMAIMTL
jgi:hypothetical protein